MKHNLIFLFVIATSLANNATGDTLNLLTPLTKGYYLTRVDHFTPQDNRIAKFVTIRSNYVNIEQVNFNHFFVLYTLGVYRR